MQWGQVIGSQARSGENQMYITSSWISNIGMGKIKYFSLEIKWGRRENQMGLAKVRPQSEETQMGNKSRPAGIVTGSGREPEI